MKIAVIDGQGGGLGKEIVGKLRKQLPEDVEILALGTNALATAAMLKAGANVGATGEGAIVYNSDKVDIIMGPIGIITANAMMGELTANMANAVSHSKVKKILIPLNKCNIEIAGIKGDDPIQYLIDCAVEMVRKYL